MIVRYDPEADLVAIEFRELPTGRWAGERIDERRYVLREKDTGEVLGVELLFVSKGIDLAGLPEEARLREALREAHAAMGAAVA